MPMFQLKNLNKKRKLKEWSISKIRLSRARDRVTLSLLLKKKTTLKKRILRKPLLAVPNGYRKISEIVINAGVLGKIRLRSGVYCSK